MEENNEDSKVEEKNESEAQGKAPSGLNPIIIIVIVIAIAGVVFYFGKDSSFLKSNQVNEMTSSPEMMEETNTENQNEMREVVVEAGEYFYSPSVITAKQGETLKIILKNTGEMTHDLVIDDLSVKTIIIAPGEETELVLPSLEAGEYKIYCSIGRHKELGMVGTLSVTE